LCSRGASIMPLANNESNGKVYIALYKLIKYLYGLVQNFPKEYKYTLGGDILTLAWETLDWVTTANGHINSQKAGYVRSALISFQKLKYRIRMAHELKLITDKKMAYLIKTDEEIIKMLRGWYRWTQGQA